MTYVQRVPKVAAQLDRGLEHGEHEKRTQDGTMDITVIFGQPHLVIGNPPYAHFNQLPKEIAEKVRKIIGTSEGDIYYAFIIQSINILQQGGDLIYIVPYHFFYNTHAKVVREHILQNGRIEVIIDLDEAHLFSKASPETIIFRFRKGSFDLDNEKIKILKLKTKSLTPRDIMVSAIETLYKRESDEVWDYKEIKHFTTSALWSTHWSSVSFQISKIPFIELGKIAKVGVGPVSGFDEAFQISENELTIMQDNEKALVKKFIKAHNCERYITRGYHYYLVIEDKISESEIKDNFPNIYKNILKHKNVLSSRYLPNGKCWFHWQALRNYNFLLENLHKKRIYVPVLDRRPYNRFSLGDEHTLPASDVIFVQPYNDDDIFFLLGYLNSSFFRDYYLSCGSRRGGRIAFTQRILDNVKIPLLNDKIKEEISNITKQIINFSHINHKTQSEEIKIEKTIRNSVFNIMMT